MKYQRLSVLIIALGLTGCTSIARFSGYQGDGHFTDAGFASYAERYKLSLGIVDLSKPGRYDYVLSTLPRAEFVISLRIKEQPDYLYRTSPHHPAMVHLLLQDELGKTVVDERTSLNSWKNRFEIATLTSHLSIPGKTVDLPLKDGTVRIDRSGIIASGGWGSHFLSAPNKSYTLSLNIIETTMNGTAQLVLTSIDQP